MSEPFVDPRLLRRHILAQSKRAHVGHIGSNLSVADIIASLYSGGLSIKNPEDPERDRLILSKGHAALALYAALHMRGWLAKEDLDHFCENGSRLGVHPDHRVRGVEYSTGSLGLGLPIGAGIALAARLKKAAFRVAVVLSDAECNEGSLWEAVMFAAHHRLHNLTAIVDVNGQQAFGSTRQVLDLAPLKERWASFGWEAIDVDGHHVGNLTAALRESAQRPRVLLCRTVFGKGVSYMEGQLKWHYWPMSETEYTQALRDTGGSPA